MKIKFYIKKQQNGGNRLYIIFVSAFLSQLAVDAASLMEYLQSSPLGSVGLPHVQQKDFVVVNHKSLKLTDLDEADLEEKTCSHSSDCFLQGTDVGKRSCCRRRSKPDNCDKKTKEKKKHSCLFVFVFPCQLLGGSQNEEAHCKCIVVHSHIVAFCVLSFSHHTHLLTR